MTDYRVQTDVYNGPMDLLLFLIKRNEIDLSDIPVSEVTEQYCQYVETIEVIDPNIAGDFLVMAAVLMELKSRMLLPRQVADTDDPEDLTDPRLELVRQLLEYKKFKDASFDLQKFAKTQAQRWPHVPIHAQSPQNRDEAQKAAPVDLDDVQIWDLVASFNRIMSAIGAGQAAHDVIFDDTPISLHAADILDRLQREGGELAFESLFVDRNKVEMIGLFMALLELMRQVRVRVIQRDLFAPILITLLSAKPIEVGDAWTPAFHDAVMGTEEASSDRADTGEESSSPPTEPALPTIDRTDDVESIIRSAQDSTEIVDGESLEGFEELDRIKVDVDIDSILKHDPRPAIENDPNQDPQEPITS